VKTFFDPKIPEEIASILEIPPHNIGSNVKRGLAGLTEAYQSLAEKRDTVIKRRPVQ
jgi:hypothetical protein